MKDYNEAIGLAKTLFNSSVCHLKQDVNGEFDIEILLTERLTRKKASGSWPFESLIHKEELKKEIPFFENRDVTTPLQYEIALNERMPFNEKLQGESLDHYLSANGDNFIPHHFAHALSSLALSPFSSSIILVMDGAGTRSDDIYRYPSEHRVGFEKKFPPPGLHEEVSAYLQVDGTLTCIYKDWQRFEKDTLSGHYYSDGLGTTYELISEYIFNDKRAAGKVMGLAPFGKASSITSRTEFLKSLDWGRAFKGKGKSEWEASTQMGHYKDIAATLQLNFEERYHVLVKMLSEKFSDIPNLILAGGCALNCTTNMQLYRAGYFKNIYVSPFPGDEGISLGCAFHHFFKSPKFTFKPAPIKYRISSFGSKAHQPFDHDVERVFTGYSIKKSLDIATEVASVLAKGEVIAWYQGRSECGPRALGNRSILTRVDRKDAKNYLNAHVKFREDFRPYGCSITQEEVSKYFDVPKDFDNSFMSFACHVRPEFKERFFEVVHVDGTSRLQTVRVEQNEIYHRLLKAVGDLTGVPALLNTSLNVMGEPIVETLEDVKRFFAEGTVDLLVVGNYIVMRDERPCN